MTLYAIAHSKDFRNTCEFNAECDNDIFSHDQARRQAEMYKRSAMPSDNTSGVYQFAGIVEADTLTGAYEASQNVAKAWAKGQRSTSVGDLVIELNDDYTYAENGFNIVSGYGFCKLAGV